MTFSTESKKSHTPCRDWPPHNTAAPPRSTTPSAFPLSLTTTTTAGHRRLLEHLSGPACPSIRRFVQQFPQTEGKPEASAPTSAPTQTPTQAPTPELGNGKGQRARKDLSEDALKDDSAGPGIGNGNCGSGSAGRAIGGRRSDGTGEVGEGGCVPNSTADALREAYNGCLSALGDFR